MAGWYRELAAGGGELQDGWQEEEGWMLTTRSDKGDAMPCLGMAQGSCFVVKNSHSCQSCTLSPQILLSRCISS